MSGRSANGAFRRRKQSHVLILASGDKVRHMTIRPWMAALATSVIGIFSIGYLAATTYLVLRDDLIGGTIARQARMQHEYEDRITALRAQVDRVTSRQLLDQQVVEDKVEKLLQQQSALWSRSDKLGALAASADTSEDLGDEASSAIDPLAFEKPADAKGGAEAIEEIMGLNREAGATPSRVSALAYAPALPETVSDRADRIFSKVTLSLKDVERDQMVRIEHLTSSANRASEAIRTIVERTGATLSAGTKEAAASKADGNAIGGPFVEPQDEDPFGKSLAVLDGALLELEETRDAARKLPLLSPAPTSDVTSNFGNRLDPFLGRLALHAGIDFRVSIGTRIRSAAAGTVTTAGPMGGYGNMVEIDHGNGVVTRYAHLSVILVNVGDHVRADDVIAKSGSTGRSTGPHLHYEVRLDGRAVDPVHFLRAGTKLAGLMN
ncbi:MULTISPECIES: M23 family metallopeptidase [unclassified Sinorhizobium]|uniref:M23 family metallopeptidase n=1 Tax=unclassified Sinorhizobium TaxID=2613772 RepID=UPI0024C3E5CC|nr:MULTISPECIES: M23 family metallopeptidase [unclassified Sinorhizobium]MDK1373021.1 M23 family metallopeptidase [Sinorhizobium sp. 6-70]MDK1482675.1 M23 family metallopeptidase [Sinorhizobium sp. 6-117]